MCKSNAEVNRRYSECAILMLKSIEDAVSVCVLLLHLYIAQHSTAQHSTARAQAYTYNDSEQTSARHRGTHIELSIRAYTVSGHNTGTTERQTDRQHKHTRGQQTQHHRSARQRQRMAQTRSANSISGQHRHQPYRRFLHSRYKDDSYTAEI